MKFAAHGLTYKFVYRSKSLVELPRLVKRKRDIYYDSVEEKKRKGKFKVK